MLAAEASPLKHRLLLLSYAFPPAALPEAYLSAKRLGSVSGYEVDVICVQPADSSVRIDNSLDPYVSERFGRIERIEIPDFLKFLSSRKIGAIFEVPGLDRVMNWKTLCAAHTLGPERYDAVVTWSQWHSIHLVGLALKRRFPKLPWIAHFSDPWTDNPFARCGELIRLYQRRLETKVYEAADVLSFTSRETIDLVFAGARSTYRAKAVELPHAFEPALYPAMSSRQDGFLVLRSIGNFYGARSPEPLFQALCILRDRAPALFKRIRVELIGSIPDVFRESQALQALPPDAVRLHSPVDYKASLALAQSADLLLNIDAPFEHSVFLPSKLVDYIGAGRPIFGITPPGTAARVIKALGGWIAGPDNSEVIASTLATALLGIERFRGGSWGDPEIRSVYEAATVARQFSRLIKDAVGASMPGVD